MYASHKLICAFIALALTACGGGSGAPAPAPWVDPPVPEHSAVGKAGVYDLDYFAFQGVYTFLEDGRFYALHFQGQQVLVGVGSPGTELEFAL